MKYLPTFVMAAVFFVMGSIAEGYPLHGSDGADIPRLEGYRKHVRVVPGAKLHLDEIELKLLEQPGFTIPEADAEFSKALKEVLGTNAEDFSIAVLDLTDPNRVHYAEHKGGIQQNPGSLGKILIGLAIFQALADMYPDDQGARMRVLNETVIEADGFIHTDSHDVPFYERETDQLSWRPVREGDTASLFTYLDWMFGASSNAAASLCLREAMLMVRFGREYPVDAKRAETFFSQTPSEELSALLRETLDGPLRRNGLNPQNFRQGGFFTRSGKQRVPGVRSRSTSREVLNFLVRMEQGRLVDSFSSLELKRLLYMTQKRFRYSASPALDHAALFYKSGSLYSCRPEPGFTCEKNRGNVYNLLNSAAIVEAPAGDPELHYMVVVTSNVLYEDAAEVHTRLGTKIHELIQHRHGLEPTDHP
ncbi:MAG: hypothetical protein ACLFNV_02165 [Desulfovibrionales bacterium]